MKPFDIIIKKKPLIISLEILLGISGANLHAESVTDEIEVEATDQTKQTTQAKKSDNTDELEAVEVEADGRGKNLLGIAGSASEGEVSQKQFEHRPLSRNGELIEVIPGAVATQHSGSGKANQYFLRGFNLDHGTDFTTFVDGIPMNMTTHAHGQGYMDINSIIPELVEKVDYGKGPYYAEVGDFAAAGYAKMHTMNKLDEGIVKFTAGQYDYYRTLIAKSNKLGDGDLLYAGEFNLYDGVWEVPEDTRKFNGMLKYTIDKQNWGMSISGKAYNNNWTATNQIPDYAIENGTLGLYGSMDPSDGGSSNRYSVAGNFWQTGENWKNEANIYSLYTDLDLYSNFSGYTLSPKNPSNQPLDPNTRYFSSDQILQTERRVQTGANFEHTRYNKILGFEMDNSIGLQFRHDDIMDLGLYQTTQRQVEATVSKSDVGVTTIGAYLKNQTHWHEKFRTITGFRADFLNNDVRVRDTTTHDSAVNDDNSGNRGKVMLSPKISMVVGPWYDTEYFVNAGYGYHSNDARGTTIRRDPTNGAFLSDSESKINPAAWSRGAEAGIRSNFIPGLNTTLAAWWLQSSQELVFVGDAGTTEINGASDRYGIEWTNYYKPTDWLTLDADYAVTTARFADTPEGATDNFIPNSVGRVISTGVLVEDTWYDTGVFGTLRMRHFGHVPLDESGNYWSGNTTIVNLGAGIKRKYYKLEIDVFNLLGSRNNDIAYAYESAYPNGSETMNGVLSHPVEPRMVRGTITVNF